MTETFIVALYKSSLVQTKGGLGAAKEHNVESLVINREKGFAFLNTTSVLGAVAMKNRYGGKKIGNQVIRIEFAKERVSMCAKLDRAVRMKRENFNLITFTCYDENITCIIHSYHKKIIRTLMLKFSLEIYET